jgi:hypothetical protein
MTKVVKPAPARQTTPLVREAAIIARLSTRAQRRCRRSELDAEPRVRDAACHGGTK